MSTQHTNSLTVWRWFQPQRIGGQSETQLDAHTLDRFAAMLSPVRGSRRTEPSLSHSVTRRAAAGGYGSLINKTSPSQIQRLFILRDRAARSGAWNKTSEELALGMKQRGIPVFYASFEQVPTLLRTGKGVEYPLHTLEKFPSSPLLIFTDSLALDEEKHRHLLTRLSERPRCAWMELREQRLWDERTALAAAYDLAVYPADAVGLDQILGYWYGGHEAVDYNAGAPDWKGVAAAGSETSLETYITRVLGDAQGWAQACAMLPPPFGAVMAQRIRRRFYPGLPALRIGRLYALPGAHSQGGAVFFSETLLNVLRRGFARQEPTRRQAVLEFLLDLAREGEPPEMERHAHLEWLWYVQRLHLELDPDAALPEIQRLLEQPLLQQVVRKELAHLCLPLPGAFNNNLECLPLCRKPQSRRGLELLKALAPDCGLAYSDQYPLRHRFWSFLDNLRNRFIRTPLAALFSPDGQSILVADAAKGALLWAPFSGDKTPLPTDDDFAAEVPLWYRIAPASKMIAGFNPASGEALTALNDNCVRLWDSSRTELSYILKDYTICLRGAAFSPDGTHLYAITADGRLWDLFKGRVLLQFRGHQRIINDLAPSPDGSCFLTASADTTARLWEAGSGALLLTLQGHTKEVNSAVFDPVGRFIVTASSDKTARLWRRSGGKLLRTLKGHKGKVYSACFSPDSSLVLTASADKTARLWDASDGSLVQVFKQNAPVYKAGFSPCGNYIVVTDAYAVHLYAG